MKKKINLLITGGGAPGIAGTIYSLRNNADHIKTKIITTDIRKNHAGQFLADKSFLIPPPEKSNYISVLKKIAKNEKIDVIIPQTTREILIISNHKSDFAKMGIGLIVSDNQAIVKANDKYMILEESKKNQVPYPNYFLCRNINELDKAVEKLGYPKNKVVIKPRTSNGMRGLRILTEEKLSPERFLNEKPTGTEIKYHELKSIFKGHKSPDFVATDFLSGKEYTVDMFRNNLGVVVIPRIRLQIRSGISFETQVDMRPDIINYSRILADSLDLKYCFGFQFKMDKHGIPKILEANPRVQGSMAITVFAGFNMIYESVKEVLGESVPIHRVKIKNNTHFIRYWGGIGSDGQKIIDRF